VRRSTCFLVLVLTLNIAHPVPAGELSRDEAVAQALREVPGGKVLSVEREKENGAVVWSLDVRSKDGKHVFELQFEVATGKLVARKEESADEQKKEAEQDRKEASSKSTHYRLGKSISVGGEGGWDYIVFDRDAKRLFVAHSDRVNVVDAATGKSAGEIPGTNGVHGIALAADFGKGFTSNGRSKNVTVFDLKTLEVQKTIETTGENPDAILYDLPTHRVFTFNGRGNNTTAIEASSGSVAGTIGLGGKPEFAVSDGEGGLFVNIEDTNEIVSIDARALTVRARWPIAPCEEPTGLALDAKKNRLFAGCSNKMMAVIDSKSGKVVTTVPIGDGNDAVVFDATRSLVLASNGDGTLTVVREDSPGSFKVVQTVKTKEGARTMTLDDGSGKIYLPAAKYGKALPATPDRPHPRPSIVPGSFEILVVSAQ